MSKAVTDGKPRGLGEDALKELHGMSCPEGPLLSSILNLGHWGPPAIH